MRRVILTSTVILASVGIAASIEHLLADEHYNPGFAQYPLLTQAHVASGGLFLALSLAQFSSTVRRRWPVFHRAAGKAALVAGGVAGAGALAMAVLFPFSGAAQTAITLPFGGLFLLALLRGAQLARAGRFAEHREWMIRALAVATSIATMRLIFVPLLITLGTEEARLLSLSSTAIAFVLNSGIAELWIRKTRTSRAEPADPSPADDLPLTRTA